MHCWTTQLVRVGLLAIAPFLLGVTPVSASVQSSLTSPVQPQLPKADQLLQQGNQQYRAGKPEAAIQLWQEARSQYQQNQSRSGEARALANLGAAYSDFQMNKPQ
jgi:hypothetical protein